MIATLLGGLTPQQFLQRHWQKKPLLVRQAIPGFDGVMMRDELLALALRDDVESRLVEYAAGRWAVTRGPLERRDLRRRPHPWTVLIQGVNLYAEAADDLLRMFDFVPWSRLDDLMVSYAVDGGGVGPHFDSYDVFLLQASGRRRWRIGAQRDLAVIENAPLRILQDFRPSREWILEPGDMLYLPPHYAHEGVAVGECVTYSIGFRAPSAQELAAGFLAHIEERIRLRGRYRDPDLTLQAHPGEVSPAMLRKTRSILDGIRWNEKDVRDFLGCYLSAPKPHVYFSAPERPLGTAGFRRRCARDGLRLDPKSQFLFAGSAFYLNGESVSVAAADRPALRRLADRRRLPATDTLSAAAIDMLYDWYCHGFLLIDGQPR